MVHTPLIERPKYVPLLGTIERLRRQHANPDGRPKLREEEYLKFSSTETLTLATHLLAEEKEEGWPEKPAAEVVAPETQIDGGKCNFIPFVPFSIVSYPKHFLM